jgi:hypothetical protein
MVQRLCFVLYVVTVSLDEPAASCLEDGGSRLSEMSGATYQAAWCHRVILQSECSCSEAIKSYNVFVPV